MARNKLKMEVVNPHAAGIDVGSKSHYVAISQQADQVREFGVYAEDLRTLVQWLQENKVTSVAMESTGTYWQSLYTEMQTAGLEVVLANGKFTKNIKGKKTDVIDCIWIQKLHTLGLLSGSFLPDEATEKLRTYCRHRADLLATAAKCTLRMQKNLRLLNLRLDVVVNDITGLTGLKIVEAVCAGETDAKTLASSRHGNCRKSEAEITKALQSNNREDFLFALRQEWDQYQFSQTQIAKCDAQIERYLNDFINQDDTKKALFIDTKVHKRINKNAPKNLDLNLVAYQYFDGIDLMAIQGLSHATVLTLMSEIGSEGIKKFETAKQFASWLRLSPNKRISGGKVLSSHTPKGSNRLKIALRQAANVVGNLKDNHLSNFFNRICFKRGRPAAISATARKLATIIWNMIVKHQSFAPPSIYEYLDQKRKRKVRELQKQIAKLDAKLDGIKVPQSVVSGTF